MRKKIKYKLNIANHNKLAAKSLFKKNNLEFTYQDYSYTEYPQHLTKEFVPNLSILDMLFNVGEHSLDLLKKNNQI